MVRDHQPGEAVFRAILPEDIDWKPFPAFPPSARLAVLVGEPTQATRPGADVGHSHGGSGRFTPGDGKHAAQMAQFGQRHRPN